MAGTNTLPSDGDDFWWNTFNIGYRTASGLRVTPETALRVASVYACVRVVVEAVASSPLVIYRRLPNGGKERATDHPLYKVLHDSPNQWQTAYEWVEMMQGHLELRQNSYSLIEPGPRGAIDALIPVHPDRVLVKRLPTGRLQYEVKNWFDGTIQLKAQEEMFHLRGLSFDGLMGMSTTAIGAEVIGTALAQQEFASRFFENDATPGGVLEHPKVLGPDGYKRVKDSWRENHGGANRHGVAVLEEGMTYKQIGLTNKDSQLLEARQFSRADIAGIFRVPPHKIGDLSRATFSNIEQQNIEFATDCIRPRLVRFEQRINEDLIEPLVLGDEDEYFCEFLMDALLRGDMKSRYDAYMQGITNGWLCPDDIRAMENMNPIGAEQGGDMFFRSANTVPLDTPAALATPGNSATVPGGSDQSEGADAKRLKDFMRASAERVIRKEVKALQRIAEKAEAAANDEEVTYRDDVETFYSGHPAFVSDAMRIPMPEAAKYVAGHCSVSSVPELKQLIAMIEQSGADVLVNLALGRKQ